MLLIILSIVFALISIFFLFMECKEVCYLKNTLRSVVGKTRLTEKEDLKKLKNYLNRTIKYETEQLAVKRPLLRHTASHILKTGYGFCGENARVSIKLMLLGSIRARRIYLFRKEWQHVLVEHIWENNWFVFDGHYDPDTLLNDDQLASIPSENITEFPDTYPNNPYLDFCRIKLLYPYFKRLSKMKLPTSVVYVIESPYLIKSIIFLFAAAIILIGLTPSFFYSYES